MALPYSTKANILEQIPEVDLAELTDDVNGTSVVDATVASRIVKADTKINTYLRGKNTVPGDPDTTPILRDWSVSLAIFYLYQRRVDLQMPDAIQVTRDNVIKALEDVRDNETLIADPLSSANTASFYKGGGAAKGCLFTTNKDGTGTLDDYYNGLALNPRGAA